MLIPLPFETRPEGPFSDSGTHRLPYLSSLEKTPVFPTPRFVGRTLRLR